MIADVDESLLRVYSFMILPGPGALNTVRANPARNG